MRHGILGIGALAFVATAAPLRAEPAISITSLPPYGALGSIGGHATGVDPETHHVAAYLYVDGWGAGARSRLPGAAALGAIAALAALRRTARGRVC